MSQSAQNKVAEFFEDYVQRVIPKGQILAVAGEELPGVLYLLEGIVEQYDITPEGNKVTVNMFKPPAFFPMSWAINQTPNAYFFAALTDLRVKQASPEKVVAFLQDTPEVAFDLLSRVYKGTDAVLKRLVLASSGVAAARLIFELIIEAYRFGVGDDNGVVVKVRQASLASRTGLARETVSRELGKLEQEGLLKMHKGEISFSVAVLETRLDIII